MAKVSGPLFSMDASGSVAGAITFSKWKGRNYIRSLVKPSNPRTGGQVGFRAMFKFLAQDWANLSDANQATWQTRADNLVASKFNGFMSLNQQRWRNFTSPTKEDPAAEAATPTTLSTFSAAGGVKQITLTMSLTSATDEWGILIYRDGSTGFTPAISNLIAAVVSDGLTDFDYVDTPLDAGTYYYRASAFTLDGINGAIKAEIDGTAT